jgi:uncharacterized membrane protein
VNHHASVKLLNGSSVSFIYANGFLLFTVVFIPFPTSLLGEHILTDHAAPAVILYNFTLALQAIGWILFSTSALKSHLGKNEKAIMQTRKSGKFAYFAFTLYSFCAIMAIWFPLPIAILTTLTWIYWLIWGTRVKHE